MVENEYSTLEDEDDNKKDSSTDAFNKPIQSTQYLILGFLQQAISSDIARRIDQVTSAAKMIRFNKKGMDWEAEGLSKLNNSIVRAARTIEDSRDFIHVFFPDELTENPRDFAFWFDEWVDYQRLYSAWITALPRGYEFLDDRQKFLAGMDCLTPKGYAKLQSDFYRWAPTKVMEIFAEITKHLDTKYTEKLTFSSFKSSA